jgi:site-specific recombinase XerD
MHYSPRTEEAYVGWIRRFVRSHQKRHPRDMGEAQVVAFLSALAVDGHLAASTQNQGLSALIFLYGQVLNVELDWLQGLVRAKRPERLPVVLTRDEVRRLLSELSGIVWLMASVMYGAGLRLLEMHRAADEGCGSCEAGASRSRRQGAQGPGHDRPVRLG